MSNIGRPKTRFPKIKECGGCGQEFLADPPEKKCCSRSCVQKAKNKNKTAKPLKIRNCEYCKEEFQFRYGNRKYCSSKCGMKKHGEELLQKNKDTYYKNPRTCKECDKVILYERRLDVKEFCSLSCAAVEFNRKIHEKKMKEYYKDLPACLNCETVIPYEKRNDASKFCNQTCYSEYTIKENLKNGVTDYSHCKVTFHICRITGKSYLATNPNGSGYRRSPYIKDDVEKYKIDSSFRFNVYDYPDYFDLSLLKEHKWYNPTTNKNGVSRDHRFSIMEGFRQNLKPRLLSHPANCVLLIHADNIVKRDKCSISSKELMNEIEQWDKKYGKYEIGYNLYYN